MKVMFLHLSDMHLKDTSRINLKVDRIADAVKSIGTVDKAVLICSGDLAFSGASIEYKNVRSFLGVLLQKIGEQLNQFVNLYIVPGNHDIMFSSDARDSAAILEYYKNNTVDKKFNNELNWQKHFFEYSSQKNCFKANKVVDKKTLNCGGYIIQINLLNTAPFSTLRADNKEIHYLPDQYLYSLVKETTADLAITVMHHSTEWFHWKTKESLEKRLNAHTDIVFQGHEHRASGTKNNALIVIKGGEFSGEMTHESTFSIVILDTEHMNLSDTIFVWNEEQVMFCKTGTVQQYSITKKTIELCPDAAFKAILYRDNKNLTNSVLDYFVFPKLFYSKRNTHDEGKIISEVSFWYELSNRKIINVSCKDGNGKSTLLKYLYNQSLTRQMLPLFLSRDDFKSKPADKLLKSLFQTQYGEDDYLFDRFEQICKNKKILFVDDLDLIKHQASREKLIEEALNHVGYIVFSSQANLEIDLSKATKTELLNHDEYFCLRIDDFYKEKRTELIKRVCAVTNPTDIQLVDYVVHIVDQLVAKRNGLFELSPDYIVEYIKFFLKRDTDDRKGEAVFNIVFETNLRNAIINNSPESKVDLNLIALEEIAFMMHKKGDERASYADIVNAIGDYNKNYEINIDIRECLETAINGRVLKKSTESNSYEFCSQNFLAYFIAKRLNRLIEKHGFDIPELKEVFDNICFGINDNILLFLSFLRDNTAFALNLCDLLDEIVDNYEELDFDKKNIRFIAKIKEIQVKSPSSDEKRQVEQMAETHERQLRLLEEQQQIQYKSIYDYRNEATKTFQHNIICALKYLEVISKSLISHYTTLDKNEKNQIISRMYSAPNKVLYALFKPHDDRYDETVAELKQIIDDSGIDIKLTKEDIERELSHAAIGICLSIYDRIAFFGANTDTLKLLDAKPLANSNYKIANLIMEENGGGTESFVKKAIKLKEDEDDNFITNLIRLITRKHILTHDIDHAMLDRLSSKIFQQSSHKQLLVMSASKKNKKE